MKTVSPHLLHDRSPSDLATHALNYQDPYLSAPSDPEEDEFKSTAKWLTPAQGEQSHGGMQDTSSPSSDLEANGDSAQNHGNTSAKENADYSLGPYQYSLGPAEDVLSDLSTQVSPPDDQWLEFVPECTDGCHVGSDHLSPQTTTKPSQLLSPRMTHDPSPASDAVAPNSYTSVSDERLALQNALTPASCHPQRTSGKSNVESEDLGERGCLGPESRSPIFKIEDCSNDNSPTINVSPSDQQLNQSHTHLAPVGTNGCAENHLGEFGLSPARGHDGSWIPSAVTGHSGVDPTNRADVYVASPNEVNEWRQQEERNEDIRYWSRSVSEANSDAGGDIPIGQGWTELRCHRPRARSAGNPSLSQDYFTYNPSTVPGPGLLVSEQSDDDFSEPESEMPASESDSFPANLSDIEGDQTVLNDLRTLERQVPEDDGPLPIRFFRPLPWQDPVRDTALKTTRMQPSSSNAAIMEFDRRARDIDTASRSATWGTRNLSENLERLSISESQTRKSEKRTSLRKLSTNFTNLKRRVSHISLPHPPSPGDGTVDDENKGDASRKDSQGSHRKLSIGRSHQRSPSLRTHSAMIAMAGQIGAIGGRGSISAASPNGTVSTEKSHPPRQRSKSELPRFPKPGLINLMTTPGASPDANAAAPANATQNHYLQVAEAGPAHADNNYVCNEDTGNKGLVMEFPTFSPLPVPTLEGFKGQITQINPRLQPALIHRLANEQLCRYKALVNLKLSHTRLVNENKCKSGTSCSVHVGDSMRLLGSSGQDPPMASTQFHTPEDNAGDTNSDDVGEGGVVVQGQFPAGVPLPPVRRLPAEFECPICFKLKKFQKPSDWTKHVHEDVQPFTCTFPECNEPKSFKRKADWVRHENERHRQLEWWICTIADCPHRCCRKNNFVQHLMREHKFPDPTAKKAKLGAVDEAQREREIDRLWQLVDDCRRDTTSSPMEEPCRFCGNVCNSWKQLTVHLAKHLEQIAMPVLKLVGERGLSFNSAAIPMGNAGLVSSPASKASAVPASGRFAYENEIAHGSNTGLKAHGWAGPATSAQTSNVHDSRLAAVQTGEPGQIRAHHDSPQYPPADLQGPPAPQAAHSQFVSGLGPPVHQGSVTFPPPFNTMPRSRGPDEEMGLVPDPYQLSLSTAENVAPIYDQHGPLYTSPTAEGSYVPPSVLTASYNTPAPDDWTSRGAAYM